MLLLWLCAWLLAAAAAEQIVLQSTLPSAWLEFTHSHVYAPSPNDQGFSLAYRRPFPLPPIAPAHLYDLSGVRFKTRQQEVWRPRAKGGSDAYKAARLSVMRDKRGIPHPLDQFV
jgi:hypothetical protein